MKGTLIFVLGFIFALIAVRWVLVDDLDDQLQQGQEYCTRVKDGAWPDYKHIYHDQCFQDGRLNKDYVYGR